MQHYWGAKAILARAGFSPKSYRKFPEYLVRHQIPAFPRRHSHRKPMFYSSEAMMIAWELNKARQFYEDVKAQQEQRLDRRYRCLDRERQTAAA
jgi:hypothetical protein